MQAAEPVFLPNTHRLDLGRLGAITLVVGILLTGPLGWACCYAVVTDPDPVAKAIAGFFGLLFGGLCVLFIANFWRVTGPRNPHRCPACPRCACESGCPAATTRSRTSSRRASASAGTPGRAGSAVSGPAAQAAAPARRSDAAEPPADRRS